MIITGALFALVLGAFIFLVLPHSNVWQRFASALIFVILIGVVYGGSIELLSRPKPLRLEWRNPAEAKVLGSSIQEGKAIYVWLQVGDSPEPRAYALPWSTKAAQQLQDATESGKRKGTGVQVSLPFQAAGNATGERKFYAPPQQALPDKSYGPNQPILYNHPETTGRGRR